MTDADTDQWPLPNYPTVGPKHAHAMGVISLNFNNLEFAFFRLFGHHFERTKMPLAMTWGLHSQLQDSRRPATLKQIFSTAEADEAVREHVEHAVSMFFICRDNRNWLFHSRMSHQPVGEMRLTKTVREDWSKVNVLDVTVSDLRRIADEMYVCWEYVFEIWSYLQRRDLKDELPAFWVATSPTTLPQKPALPRSLVPSQIARGDLA
jgi:hypothetical protein